MKRKNSWLNCYIIKLLHFFIVSLFISLLLVKPVFAQYDDYIWQTFQTHSISGAEDLQAKLNEEVQKIVSSGHLAPFKFVFDGHKGDNYYWSNPGDSISALSYAYPYISSELQPQLKTYLKNEIVNYSPWNSNYLYIDEGTRREYGQVPPLSHTQKGFRCQDYPWLQNLYGLWLYAYNTDDWQTIKDNWYSIEVFYNAHQDDVYLYSGACGAIGFARMAEHLGETAKRDEAVDLIENNLGGDFASFNLGAEERLNGFNYDHGDRHGPGSGVLYFPITFDLCPEVGQFLHDHRLAEVEESFNHLAYIAPTWYMAKGVLFSEIQHSEIIFNPPNSNWGPFLAEAFVLQKPGAELRKHIGTSYTRVGDLYYIAKLTSAIRAHGTTVWYDVRSARKSVSQVTADHGDVLTYTISLLGTGATTTITDNIPAGTAYVPNSAQVEPEVGTLTADANLIHWTGVLTEDVPLELTFAVTVIVTEPFAIVNTTIVDNSENNHEPTATTIANGLKSYLPTVLKRKW